MVFTLGEHTRLPHIARQRHHDVPASPLDAALTRTSTSATHGRQHVSPTGAGSKVGLEVMPIDSMTPSAGHGPGERTPSRSVPNRARLLLVRVAPKLDDL
jgi:hypothetical protein